MKMSGKDPYSSGVERDDLLPPIRDGDSHGSRRFYDLKSSGASGSVSSALPEDDGDVFSFIRNNVIGKDTVFKGPYGPRKVLYCDYIASGRSLEFIEDYIRSEVLPYYGNTHTTTTVTSLQTTLFRHEARDIIRNSVRASERDAVVFVGSGTTGAIHKLVNALKPLFEIHSPVVFVGPYEHHSNLLPWRELGGEIIRVKETNDGLVDVEDLEEKLRNCVAPPEALKIGCFAVASNVTGIISPDLVISSILRQYGALSFWDCASSAPYMNLDMNPKGPWGIIAKDAMFFSMHKFIGGPETPGILVAKEDLFVNRAPEVPGGGTVFFVTEKEHSYLKNIEDREEGGTPPIIQSIRAGLAMRVKEWATVQAISEREELLSIKAFDHWSSCKELVILGSHSAPRLPIFSFLVKPKKSRFLHHNFVSSVLNDVFGIQVRGGCACAGPYAEDLLGISLELARAYEKLLKEDDRLDRHHLRRREEGSQYEMLRPGFARLNLTYFLSDEEVDFILQAVQLVAKNAWKLLPFYKFNPETAEWMHTSESIFQDRRWLASVTLEGGKLVYTRPPPDVKGKPPGSFEELLEEGKRIFRLAEEESKKLSLPDHTVMYRNVDHLRWFMLPSEALELLQTSGKASVANSVPFKPKIYEEYHRRDWTLYMKNVSGISTASIISKALHAAKKMKKAAKNEMNGHVETKRELKTGVVEMNDGEHRQGQVAARRELFQELLEKANPKTVIHGADSIENVRSRRRRSQELTPEPENGLDDAVTNPAVREQGSESPGSDDHSRKDVHFLDDELPKEDSPGPTWDRREVSRTCQENSPSCPAKPATRPLALDADLMISKGWHSPPKDIYNRTIEAINEFHMIRDGDKVLVCLSGGKDSLSLLHTLHQYQYAASAKGIRFQLGAATVDPQSSHYDPSPLIPYLMALGVTYLYEEQGIIQQAAKVQDLASICSFCSRMKRGRLYAAARRDKWNVLALGQHLDDLAESFFMSIFHNGRLRTMKAHYSVRERDLRVIRPFVYVREKDLRAFAERQGLPVIPENCPGCFDAPKERYRIKQMLAQQEILYPKLFSSLLSALHPLMSFGEVGVESKIMGTRFAWKKSASSNSDPEFSFNMDDEDADRAGAGRRGMSNMEADTDFPQ